MQLEEQRNASKGKEALPSKDDEVGTGSRFTNGRAPNTVGSFEKSGVTWYI
jgi:hypothetical protein